jgi:hypothetical protein
VHDGRTSAPLQSYTFPSVQAYLDAKNGVNRLGYANFSQVFGELSFTMNTQILGAFVQDDWQLSPSLKFLYGVRYDVYKPPSGVDNAPYENNREFKTDTNNFGPRAGIAWTADAAHRRSRQQRLMYDQPILIAYENALQFSGSPRTFTVSLRPTAAGAPAFPVEPARTCRRVRAADAVRSPRSIPTSRSRARGRTTCKSSARSGRTTPCRSATRTR